jgi:hypothetical protein
MEKEVDPLQELVRPEEPKDPYAGVLYEKRQELEGVGYTFRIPINWGSPIEAGVPGADVTLQNLEGDSSIVIARRPMPQIEHYGHWVLFRDRFIESVKSNLSEVRVRDTAPVIISGKIGIMIEHTHLLNGKVHYSQKIAFWMAGESAGQGQAVIVNFNTDFQLADEMKPAFTAFVEALEYDDPDATKVPAIEPDYIGEWRDDDRGIILPVQRHAKQVGVTEDMQGVFARWDLAPATISLGEHESGGNLASYGAYQKRVLQNMQAIRLNDANVVNLKDHEVYKLDFTVNKNHRSLMYIYFRKPIFYQIICGVDVHSFPYFHDFFDALAGDIQFVDAVGK